MRNGQIRRYRRVSLPTLRFTTRARTPNANGGDSGRARGISRVAFPMLQSRAIFCASIWGGFVFINLDPAAISLPEYLSAVPCLLDPYQPADMIVVKDVTAEWPVNWKILLDAFLEGYHAHCRQPELIRLIDDYHFQHDLFGHGHSRMIISIGLKHREGMDSKERSAHVF